MTEIKTKSFNFGHEHEAEWPPRFPEKKEGYVAYWDSKTQTMVEGYPPPRETFGQAPMVIFDTMKPQYHEAAGRTIDSIKEWDRTDKEHNTITFSSIEQAKPKVDHANERKRKKAELRKASKTALDVYKANPREVSQKVQKQGEAQMEVLKKSGLKKLLKQSGVKV